MTTARDVIAASDCVWHFCAQHKKICLAEADRMIAALEAAGFKVLAREPTTAMLHAMTMVVPTWDDDISRAKWNAALDATEPERKEP